MAQSAVDKAPLGPKLDALTAEKVSAGRTSQARRGLVFDRDLNQTIEIKRIESNRRTFKTKKQAEQYGLDLCKTWVDKRP